MKENTRKYLIIGGLFIAVFALVTAKNLKTQQQAESLSDDSIIGKGKPVLLELGSHGCKPCDAMMPILTELAEEQTDFEVAFVDVKANRDKAKQYGIQVIPVQIFFDADGKELFRHIHVFSKEDILAKWDELLNQSGPPRPNPENLTDDNVIPSETGCSGNCQG